MFIIPEVRRKSGKDSTSLSRKDIDMAGIGAGCTFLYSVGITQHAYSSVTLSDSLILLTCFNCLQQWHVSPRPAMQLQCAVTIFHVHSARIHGIRVFLIKRCEWLNYINYMQRDKLEITCIVPLRKKFQLCTDVVRICAQTQLDTFWRIYSSDSFTVIPTVL